MLEPVAIVRFQRPRILPPPTVILLVNVLMRGRAFEKTGDVVLRSFVSNRSPWTVRVSRGERSQSDRKPPWNPCQPSDASWPLGELELSILKYLPKARYAPFWPIPPPY